MAQTYDYSRSHRLLEICSIGGLGLIVTLMGYEVYMGLIHTFPGTAWWVVPTTVLVAYLAADFVSGFVHFVGDTFGDENTPVVGPGFVKPFREHHVDPRGITRHDFIETNGNNCIVCIPAALLVYYAIPARTDMWALLFVSFTAWFMFWIFMTNQFHKWSHLEEIPPWIQRLQSWRLILSPNHHDIHHTPPFDTYYCITTGWLNPFLHRVRFFPITEAVIRWIFRSPKSTTPTEASGPS